MQSVQVGYNMTMMVYHSKIRRAGLLAIMSLTLMTLLMFSGCVQRTITITSEPQGALVFLNDEEVGRTPLTVPFVYYGVYDVRLEAEGCQTLWTKERAEQPMWDYMGPDIIAEALPWGAKSRQEWHFKLPPAQPENQDAVISHAKQMRSMLKKGEDEQN